MSAATPAAAGVVPQLPDREKTTGHTTRYDAASDILRHEIEHGRFADATLLPGERELAALLQVSRTTLRRAVATLVGEGLLKQRQGLGTFVVARAQPEAPHAEALLPEHGLAQEVNLERRISGARLIEAGTALPSPEEAMLLGGSPTERVVVLSRLLLAADQPFALEHAVAPSRFLPEGLEEDLSLDGALARRGFRPIRALQRVRATLCSELEAGRLGVPAASPGLSVHSTAYLADGQCCLFTRSLYRSDLYDAVFEIRYPAAAREEPA